MTFLAHSQRGAAYILFESTMRYILPQHLLLWLTVQAVCYFRDVQFEC